MKNKKGFTLIELLAVIVILGLLIAIAIPIITKYITQSKKKTLATTISKYVEASILSVNNGEFAFTDSNVIYAVPIECIPMERDGSNPFGEWLQVNNKYWAYVLVQYDPEAFCYKYGFTFKDSAGFGMYPIILDEMDSKGKDILTNLSLQQPRTTTKTLNGKYWENSGFIINSNTKLKVLTSKFDEPGNGIDTCTLHQKGLNYEEIEEIRSRSGTLLNQGNYGSQVFGKKISRTEVEEIYTLDYIDIPTDVIDSWDVSIQKNESVMAYITDEDNDELYELYLAQEGGVIAPANSGYLFGHFKNVTILDLSNLVTKNITSMSNMFLYCSKVKVLDVSKFDTSKVLNMNDMFYGCGNVGALDVSNWDTSNVTNMYGLFNGCSKVEELDVSKWQTTNVTTMSKMFNGCNSLIALNVSNFDTSKVTNMSGMFSGCSKLTMLDVSNFDTSNVTTMSETFLNCRKLNNLDLGNWNTTKVTNMYHMFKACQSLLTLNIDNFDTSNVTNMYGMFMYCSNLSSINLSRFNTSKVTNMGGMFYGCGNVSVLDVSNWDTSNVTNMYWLFNGCSKVEELDVSKWQTTKVTNMAGMFNGCNKLTMLDVSNFNTGNVTNMENMFKGIGSLTNLDLSNFDTSKVTNMGSMFQNMISLKTLDLSSFDTSGVTSYSNIFNRVPTTIKIIVKDDATRNWIQTNINSDYKNIVTVGELQ